MDTKMIAFLFVGIVVGAAVGAGAGYMMWNESDDETYWFYMNYGTGETTEQENGWISASATNGKDALVKALDSKGIEVTFNDFNMITSIGTVVDGIGGENWMYRVWSSEKYETEYGSWYPTTIIHESIGTVFYFVFCEYTPSWDPVVDPMDTDDWKTGGPFPAA